MFLLQRTHMRPKSRNPFNCKLGTRSQEGVQNIPSSVRMRLEYFSGLLQTSSARTLCWRQANDQPVSMTLANKFPRQPCRSCPRCLYHLPASVFSDYHVRRPLAAANPCYGGVLFVPTVCFHQQFPFNCSFGYLGPLRLSPLPQRPLPPPSFHRSEPKTEDIFSPLSTPNCKSAIDGC